MSHISVGIYLRISELIARHGSLRAAARAVHIDHAYLSRLHTGAKRWPSKDVLRKLDLERVITYRRISK